MGTESQSTELTTKRKPKPSCVMSKTVSQVRTVWTGRTG